MTDTIHTSTDDADRSTPDDAGPRIDPALAAGRSKLALFAGLAAFALGTVLSAGAVVWGGLAVVAVAFALNTAGKLAHYRRLPVSRSDERRLSASWVLLAVSVVALLANYALARYGPGDGQFFWSLGVAAIGFALLHMAAQSKYLADVDAAESA